MGWKCLEHSNAWEKILSGEALAITRMHRCCGRISERRRCDGCHKRFVSLGCTTRIVRYPDASIKVLDSCCSRVEKSFILGLEEEYTQEVFCPFCHERLSCHMPPLPFQTNKDWLAILSSLFENTLLPELIRIICDYDGYQPDTPPIKRCVVCKTEIKK